LESAEYSATNPYKNLYKSNNGLRGFKGRS
jgi:hypothetical protein